MLDHVVKDINAAKYAELRRIKQEHGENYASVHEAYGVLAEEMHEAELEYVCAKDMFADLIDSIHKGRRSMIDSELEGIERYAIKAACELVQVAAVCRKELNGGAMRGESS